MTVAVDNKDGCLNIPFKQPTRISRERTVTMYPTSDDYYKAIEQMANELFENVKKSFIVSYYTYLCYRCILQTRNRW